jgi:hypothetical protein
MSYRNFTPHTINVQLANGESREFPSEGVARVTESQVVVDTHDGVELRGTTYGRIEGLPEEEGDGKTRFIVSMLVRQVNASRYAPRDDLVSPDTGRSCIRDEKGQIKAVTGFCI